MKIDPAQIVAALKAAALPVAEKDLILVVDTVLANIKTQAVAQSGDAVAGIVVLLLGAMQPAIDQMLANALPAAAGASA